jgi:hypothetical protein
VSSQTTTLRKKGFYTAADGTEQWVDRTFTVYLPSEALPAFHQFMLSEEFPSAAQAGCALIQMALTAMPPDIVLNKAARTKAYRETRTFLMGELGRFFRQLKADIEAANKE